MLRLVSVSLMCLLAATLSAYGDYTFVPLFGGNSSASVAQGGSITLELDLTTDGSDTNTSAIFEVGFSKNGLTYSDYDWQSPYVTGSGDDWSDPPGGAITGNLYFENFLPDPDVWSATSATLLTLTLGVPGGFELGDVIITTIPDTFDDGTRSIPTTGGAFTLTVIPEPASMVLMALGGLALIRRRE